MLLQSGDQAENLMMRVSRASGIAGLASIVEASWLSLGTTAAGQKHGEH